MGKTIVITGADFSDVSIGHVDLPKELSGDALAWIEASGNPSMTDNQKYAIDDFISETSSVRSKLKVLYIPMIASGLTKAFINYATVAFNDDTPAGLSTYVGYKDKGIYSLGDSYPNTCPISLATGISITNASFFIVYMNDFITPALGSPTQLPGLFLGSGASDRVGVYDMITNTAYKFVPKLDGILGNSDLYNDTTTNKYKKGTRGTSFVSDAWRVVKADGSVESGTYPSTPTARTLSSLHLLSKPALNGFSEDDTVWGMVAVGTALTDLEMQAFKISADKLMTAFIS